MTWPMSWTLRTVCGTLLIAIFSLASPASAQTVCEEHMIRVSQAYDIPVGVLYSVGLTESGRRSSLQPYALNIQGKAFFGTTKEDAMAAFNAARNEGKKLIDIGCMQINHYYHRDQFPSLDSMFDPATNVEYSARFLKKLKARHATWTMAVARYHAGPNNNPAQQRYVCTVIRNMVATGFGQWTDTARSFCGNSFYGGLAAAK